MDIPSTHIKDLARRLVSVEAAGRMASDTRSLEFACEKLRGPLTRLVGVEGFLALVRRSLALARADIPLLPALMGDAEGCIEWRDQIIAADVDADEVNLAITARLIWLLVTFVGEPIALRLVREAWPEVEMDQ